MVTRAEIEALGKRIGEEFGAERVILFGSHALGTAGPDSDVDLLAIIAGVARPVRKEAEILARIRPPFAVDLLVDTPEHIAARLARGDRFLGGVLSEGRSLYGPLAR
jgi:predicted nucleotidyltransferase